MQKQKEPIGDYLQRENVELHVAPGLSRAAYEKTRHNTFLAAITAWNYLDNSDRVRIRLPDKLDSDVLTFPTQEGIFTEREVDSDNDAA